MIKFYFGGAMHYWRHYLASSSFSFYLLRLLLFHPLHFLLRFPLFHLPYFCVHSLLIFFSFISLIFSIFFSSSSSSFSYFLDPRPFSSRFVLPIPLQKLHLPPSSPSFSPRAVISHWFKSPMTHSLLNIQDLFAF